MSRNRIILYCILVAFHVGAFIFTLRIQNFDYAMQTLKYISWFKYLTFLGMLLIATDFFWSWIVNRDSKKEKAALTHELNTLKAKLFDLQEVAKAKASEAAAKSAPKN